MIILHHCSQQTTYWGKTDQLNGLYNRGGVLYPFGVVDILKFKQNELVSVNAGVTLVLFINI